MADIARRRDRLLQEIADVLLDAEAPLVAIDGPDAAGKTTLADELAALVADSGRHVQRVSLDGFHRPRAERLARGELSPEGYVDDSFDLPALRRDVLEPLQRGGSRVITPSRFDWRTDRPATADSVPVPPDACVIVDGVFLLRGDLAPAWSASVFVFARPDVVLRRARERDADALGGVTEVERRYVSRYLPGQALYFARERPHERATVCLDNSDPEAPVVSREAVAQGVARWIDVYSLD
jgi:uridine kinase